MIYHYTANDTLTSILNNFKNSNDKKHLEFWASGIYFMNDPSEMYVGYEVLKNLAPHIEKALCIKKLFKVLDDTIVLNCTPKETEKYLKEHFFNFERMPYVISFSRNKDWLPMWSMYSKKGQGVSFEFDEKILNHLPDTLAYHTIYVDNTINEDDLKWLVQYITNAYRVYESTFGEIDSYEENLMRISVLLNIISPIIKSRSYEYEKEVRFIRFSQVKDVLYRNGPNGIPIPYIKIPIPKDAITSITIGPGTKTALLRKSVEFELKTCGLDIEVKSSEIPYR